VINIAKCFRDIGQCFCHSNLIPKSNKVWSKL
jgi:hypothetical protein